MFGQYKRLRNEFTGILTEDFLRGSLIRPEATGYETYTRSKYAGN
jgi:glutamate dehydrogenase (NADP+)